MKLTNHEMQSPKNSQTAGYSGTPLIKKLGIKEESTVIIINSPESYNNYLGELPAGAVLKSKLTGKFDFIHYFTKSKNDFQEKYPAMKKALNKDGQLWISWPKKSSKVTTDLTEDIIRNYALKNGLVDVKVCAIDETWSGLKLVYRLKDR
jgi:hypothetical protein